MEEELDRPRCAQNWPPLQAGAMWRCGVPWTQCSLHLLCGESFTSCSEAVGSLSLKVPWSHAVLDLNTAEPKLAALQAEGSEYKVSRLAP